MFPQNQNNPNLNVAPPQGNQQPNSAPELGNIVANLSPNAANIPPAMPEIAPIQSQERLSNPEAQTGHGQSQTPQDDQAAVVPVPDLVASPVVTPQDNQTAITTSAPTVAADEDLIEKEWVDQAKKIVSKTKHDPYEQARLVSELMRDYIKKRYGRVIGKAREYLDGWNSWRYCDCPYYSRCDCGNYCNYLFTDA